MVTIYIDKNIKGHIINVEKTFKNLNYIFFLLKN